MLIDDKRTFGGFGMPRLRCLYYTKEVCNKFPFDETMRTVRLMFLISKLNHLNH